MVMQVVDGELVTRDFLGVHQHQIAPPAAAAAVHGCSLKQKTSWCSLLPVEDGLSRPHLHARITAATNTAAPPSTGKAALLALAGQYQSVCTIDKVRLALDRIGCRPSPSSRQSEGSSTTSNSSLKRRRGEEEADSAAGSGAGMVASACSRCLVYVLTSRGDPRCPRCNLHVPAAVPAPAPAPAPTPRKAKQPRAIDLNRDFFL